MAAKEAKSAHDETKALTERLGRWYVTPSRPLPGGVFLTEVNAPGARPGEETWGTANRRIDALYIGFASSRGQMLEGHEVKVSRSDWLAELAQVHKADWWFSHTHRWWVVALHRDIVAEGELPEGWGLLVPSARARTRFDVVVPATVREPLVDGGLVLEVVKKMDVVRRDALRRMDGEMQYLIRQGVQKGLAQMSQKDLERAAEDVTRWREALEEFEKASGVRVTQWRAGNIGEAVRRVLAGEDVARQQRQGLTEIARSAQNLLRRTEQEIKRLDDAKNVTPPAS